MGPWRMAMGLVLVLGTTAVAWAEDVTITTYYPSPRGVYSEVQAQELRDYDDPVNRFVDPSGSTSLNQLTVDTLTDLGNLRVSGDLTVDGNTTLGNGAVDLHTVTGNMTLNNNLSVTGPTDLNNRLNVDGPTTLNSLTTITAGGLSVTGATDLNTTLNVDGPTTLNNATTITAGGLSVTGPTDLNTTLNVDGTSTLRSAVAITAGGLDVTGPTTLRNGLTVIGDLNVAQLKVSDYVSVRADAVRLDNDITTTSGITATGTITGGDITCNNCLNATDIAADAVGWSELANDSVDSAAIMLDTIQAIDIAPDAVGASEIATNGVGALEIAPDSVGDSELFNAGTWTLTGGLNISGDVGIGTAPGPDFIGWPGSLHVNGQVRAARYYDDDPAYYIESNGTSVMNSISAAGNVSAAGTVSGGNVTAGGVNVCRQNGVNCAVCACSCP